MTSCGPNTRCDNGTCSCLANYHGDPYKGCQPECILNADCPKEKHCIRYQCFDACQSTCGQNAKCEVYNHIPICSCLVGFTGNAFISCSEIKGILITLILYDRTVNLLFQYTSLQILAIPLHVDPTVNVKK